MNVQYSVEDIPGKGKGLVARQFIKKGDVVWTPINPKYSNLKLLKWANQSELNAFLKNKSENEIKWILNHAWCDKTDMKVWYCHEDDGSFFNHSATQNNCIASGLVNIATRDINIGEELVDDYSQYADDMFPWYDQICKQYNVETQMDVVHIVAEIEKKQQQEVSSKKASSTAPSVVFAAFTLSLGLILWNKRAAITTKA